MLEIRFDGLIVRFTNFEIRAQIGLYEYINIYLRNTMIIVKTHSENSTTPPPPSFFLSVHSTKINPIPYQSSKGVVSFEIQGRLLEFGFRGRPLRRFGRSGFFR